MDYSEETLENEEDWEDEDVGIKEILKKRIKKGVVEYYVVWQGEESPVWEKEDDIIEEHALAIKKFQKNTSEQMEKIKSVQEADLLTKIAQIQYSERKFNQYSHTKAPRFIRSSGTIFSLKKRKEKEIPIPVYVPPVYVPPPPIIDIEKTLEILAKLRSLYDNEKEIGLLTDRKEEISNVPYSSDILDQIKSQMPVVEAKSK